MKKRGAKLAPRAISRPTVVPAHPIFGTAEIGTLGAHVG